MAFWDEWEFDIGTVGLVLGIWSVMGLVLIKGLLFGDVMSTITLFGMSWKVARIVLWILALPIGYIWVSYILNKD